MRKILHWGVAVWLVLMASGCASKSDLNDLAAQVTNLSLKQRDLQNAVSDQGAAIKQLNDRQSVVEKDVAEMNAKLDRVFMKAQTK